MKKSMLIALVAVLSAAIVACGEFQSAKFNSNSKGDLNTNNPYGTNYGIEGPQPTVNSSVGLLSKSVSEVLTFIPDCDANTNGIECMILMDSFERNDPEADTALGFGWSQIIDDVLGGNGRRVTADIYEEIDMGPTPDAITDVNNDLGRALWFSGRNGGSVHSIYLISDVMDLSNYNSVMIAYQYLPVDLEIWNWKGDSDFENVRLEVCQDTLEACGLGATINKDRLNSDAWVTYSRSVDDEGTGLNGHNHLLTDWRDAYTDIDLTLLDDDIRGNFVFRVAVTIDEGFNRSLNNNTPDIDSNMRDGIGVDNVVALASRVVVVDAVNPDPNPDVPPGTVGPNPNDPPATGTPTTPTDPTTPTNPTNPNDQSDDNNGSSL